MRSKLIYLFLLVLCCFSSIPGSCEPAVDAHFVQPPQEAQPWVYWFWLNGNITREGITADLEAMKRVGVGGVLIMEVDQGAPVGPADFMGAEWRELFQFVVEEARRLGLEVNMNNDAGWNGSGGPWIQPEQAMQKIVWTDTALKGPSRFEGTLKQPEIVAGYYKDIVTLAFPTPAEEYTIPNIAAKSALHIGGSGIDERVISPAAVIPKDGIVDISTQMGPDGRLVWEVPEGEWTVVRFGHTCTGVENAPAPSTGRGLECDKLSKEGIEANFAGMMAKLATDNKIVPGMKNPGLVATHIDSWENGSQNWTKAMREEFKARRGYDLFAYFPVLTGRVVDSLEISERVLWDVRQTVSELVIENYAGHMRTLAHEHGMTFTCEAYGSPCDSLPYAAECDEPMGEFWTPGGGAMETCRGMASAGHVYGKTIIGAETFTASDDERWKLHPATIKALGDRAFCEGINRFVFHRYAMQPWKEPRLPGMTMGPWGQHYERTQTWWEQTTGWHAYLSRCQHMLRQGRYVADICYLQPQTPPYGFGDHPREGYAWDECSADAVLNLMRVENGWITLPSGMQYRVLVLPATRTMTPDLLRKIKDLVEDGATVIGAPPHKSPSLAGYPAVDAEVQALAAELWGDCDGQSVKERRYGKGRIIWAAKPETVFKAVGVPADFSGVEELRFIHRRSDAMDLYFISNSTNGYLDTTGTFRIQGKAPELWWPDSGRIEPAPLYTQDRDTTTVALSLEPAGSVFVVFRNEEQKKNGIVSLSKDDQPLFSALAEPPVKAQIDKATYGIPGDAARNRDVKAEIQAMVDDGEREIEVKRLAQSGDPAVDTPKTLVVQYTIEEQSYQVKGQDSDTVYLGKDALHITIQKARYGVLTDPARTRDVKEKLQRLLDTGLDEFRVAEMAAGDDPAFLVVKTLEFDYTLDGKAYSATGKDPDIIRLKAKDAIAHPIIAAVEGNAKGSPVLLAFEPGTYTWKTTNEVIHTATISQVPAAQAIYGPWTVKFTPGWGAPDEAVFDALECWSQHPTPGIQYYSGTATYHTTLTVPAAMMEPGQRLYLDLGQVEVMAEVKINGKDLALLWKPPYRVDLTDWVKEGENTLEVAVTNLWPNRMIGDEFLPEDSERHPNGTLKAWPDWLQEGKPSPAGRFTFTSWRLWKKDDALLPSGLLGPVNLHCAKVVPLQ